MVKKTVYFSLIDKRSNQELKHKKAKANHRATILLCWQLLPLRNTANLCKL